MKKNKVMFGYKEDIENKGITGWLKAHTSFMKPLHKYEGQIELTDDELILEAKKFSERIKRDKITDVYLGFDDTFRRGDDRSEGLTFQPLRVKYEKSGKEKTLYLITDFSRLKKTTNNKEWYDALSDWLKE